MKSSSWLPKTMVQYFMRPHVRMGSTVGGVFWSQFYGRWHRPSAVGGSFIRFPTLMVTFIDHVQLSFENDSFGWVVLSCFGWQLTLRHSPRSTWSGSQWIYHDVTLIYCNHGSRDSTQRRWQLGVKHVQTRGWNGDVQCPIFRQNHEYTRYRSLLVASFVGCPTFMKMDCSSWKQHPNPINALWCHSV